MGPLPDSFLRIEEHNAQLQQEAADQQAALALQQLQMQNMPMAHDPRVGRLSITIAQVRIFLYYLHNYLLTLKGKVFPGQISKKLWNDKNGSLCKITSGTCSI